MMKTRWIFVLVALACIGPPAGHINRGVLGNVFSRAVCHSSSSLEKTLNGSDVTGVRLHSNIITEGDGRASKNAPVTLGISEQLSDWQTFGKVGINVE